MSNRMEQLQNCRRQAIDLSELANGEGSIGWARVVLLIVDLATIVIGHLCEDHGEYPPLTGGPDKPK
jgi:hypothetical protein